MGATLDRNGTQDARRAVSRAGLKYFLCIEKWHGRTLIAVCSEAVSHPREDKGRFRHIPLSDGDAQLDIKLLDRLFAREIYGLKPEEKIRDAAFLERLVRIIKTSKFEGEIANTKALYEKITGRPYVDGAP